MSDGYSEIVLAPTEPRKVEVKRYHTMASYLSPCVCVRTRTVSVPLIGRVHALDPVTLPRLFHILKGDEAQRKRFVEASRFEQETEGLSASKGT